MPDPTPVAIPKKYATWFQKNRQWPVTVTTTPTSAKVSGGKPYRLHHLGHDRVAVYRDFNGEGIPMGEITPQGILRPLSDAARHDLGVIRAAIFGVSYPAPMTYVMGNRDLVHPGPCFNKHHSVLIKKVLHSVSDEEARCSVCKEAFE